MEALSKALSEALSVTLSEAKQKIAESTDLPILLYNIPGRTGITMKPETIAELAKRHKNIFAVKQSLADMDVITCTNGRSN